MGTLKILSFGGQSFFDRAEAGLALADELRHLTGESLVVLGIPRGGVVVAREIAMSLAGELDIVLTRKIAAPGNPEFAIGAMTESGRAFLEEDILDRVGAGADYIQQEKSRAAVEIARQSRVYRQNRPKLSLAGKTVIVTDDGVATGFTAQAALWSARQEHPLRLVGAFPVGPMDSLQRLAEYADEVICLRSPEAFGAVGMHYRHFEQISDQQVLDLLSSPVAQGGCHER